MKTSFFLFIITVLACGANAADSYRSLMSLKADEYNFNSRICCFIDWGLNGWFSNSLIFPDAEILNLQTGKEVKISELVKKRPIVLQTGSLTCPSYHLNVNGIKKLREKYSKEIDFYTLYVRENHPTEQIKIHKSFNQKIHYAKKLIKSRKIKQNFLIDTIEGSLHQKLGNFGNSIYLIGKDRFVNHWSIFANPIISILNNRIYE